MTKNSNKNSANSLKIASLQKLPKKESIVDRSKAMQDIFVRDIKYLKTKDVKRGMSKLIQMYCKGEILTDEAKTLTYLFSTYIQIITQFELETRIKKLEENVK